jgi:DNA-directed RNA polymerase subunit E'/Rpb7
MFLPIRFKTSIELTPNDLIDDFNTIIQEKLQAKLEGICTRYGYIKPGSLEIVRRSSGKFVKQHFNGHIHFDMICKGEVCNPPKGLIVEARVKNKNTLGLLAEGMMVINNEKIPILDIIIPKKAAGILSEIDIDEVEIGDTVNVMIMGKRFQLNDIKISIIGRCVKQKSNTVDEEDEIDALGEIEEEGDMSEEEDIEDEDIKGEELSDDDMPAQYGSARKTSDDKKTKVVTIDDEEEIEGGLEDVDEELDDEEEVDDDYEDDGGEGVDGIYYEE